MQFLDEFEEGFKNLDNLSLVKGPEVAPSKPAKTTPVPGNNPKVTQPPKFTGTKPVAEVNNKPAKKEPQGQKSVKPPQTAVPKAPAANGTVKNEDNPRSGTINISTSNVQKMTQDEIDELKDKINNKLNPEQ